MRQLTFLFLFISLTTYSQGHYPLGDFLDTLDIPNIIVSGRASYDTSPALLKDNDFAPIGYVNWDLPEPINYPDSFTFRPFSMVWDGGKIQYNYNIKDEIANTHLDSIYYIAKDGDDSNDGLSWEYPKKNLANLILLPSAKVIYIKNGLYYRQDHGIQNTILYNKDTLIIKGFGDVKLTTFESPLTYSWSNFSGNVYTTKVDSITNVIDFKFIDNIGLYMPYKRITSGGVQGVQDSAGSFFVRNDSVYVHTYNSRVPDEEIKISNGYVNSFRFTHVRDSLYMYTENIKFFGTGINFRRQSTGRQTNFHYRAIDCDYAFSTRQFTGDILQSSYGLFADGITSCYTENCWAYYNEGDGFHYENSSLSNSYTNVIELNNKGMRNGIINKNFLPTPRDASNGSSTHGRTNIYRLNGCYYENRGQNISDIGINRNLVAGCAAWNTLAPINTDTGRDADYGVNDGQMYIFNSIAYGSKYSCYALSLIDPLVKGSFIIKKCKFLSTVIQ